jgi:hypothetical protein
VALRYRNLRHRLSALKIIQFTTFYLFLLWIDTSPSLFNYVCFRADLFSDAVSPGSGDQ